MTALDFKIQNNSGYFWKKFLQRIFCISTSSIENLNNNLILSWLLRVIFPDTNSPGLNKWYQLGNADSYTQNTRGFKFLYLNLIIFTPPSFTVINESIFNMLSSEGHLIYTHDNVDESQNNYAEWRSYTKISQPTKKKKKAKNKKKKDPHGIISLHKTL